jgi:hypothetical protein
MLVAGRNVHGQHQPQVGHHEAVIAVRPVPACEDCSSPRTAEHPFGTIKCWMGATHFLMRRLGKVSTEMALNVLAYGVVPLLEAMTM